MSFYPLKISACLNEKITISPTKAYPIALNIYEQIGDILEGDHFYTNVLPLNGSYIQEYIKSADFVFVLCIDGFISVTINGETEILYKGDAALLPTDSDDIFFFAKRAKFFGSYYCSLKNRVTLKS